MLTENINNCFTQREREKLVMTFQKIKIFGRWMKQQLNIQKPQSWKNKYFEIVDNSILSTNVKKNNWPFLKIFKSNFHNKISENFFFLI